MYCVSRYCKRNGAPALSNIAVAIRHLPLGPGEREVEHDLPRHGALNGERIIVVVEDDNVLAFDLAEQLRSLGATILGPEPLPIHALQF
jgi:hypothetical protein